MAVAASGPASRVPPASAPAEQGRIPPEQGRSPAEEGGSLPAAPSPEPSPGGRLALVLSGGGARGAYQVGALRAVCEQWRQHPFRLISGSSIGAVHAAVVAHGVESGDLAGALRRLEAAWLVPGNPLRPNWRSWLSTAVRLVRYGLTGEALAAFRSVFDDLPVRCRLAAVIPPELTFGDLSRVELIVTATDLNTGRTAVFDRRTPRVRVLDAALASTAIPVIFPSRQVPGAGEDWYVDGGVFDNTPLGHVIRRGAGDVLVISTQARCGRNGPQVEGGPFADAVSVVRRLWPLLLDRLLYEDLRRARLVNEILAIIEADPDPDGVTVARLKAAIGYEDGGRRKVAVGLTELCPDRDLTPPGTLGFDDLAAIRACMEQGYRDALRILAGTAVQDGDRDPGAPGTPLPS